MKTLRATLRPARPRLCLALALLLCLQGCYVTDQGSHYLALLSTARPVQGLLKDPTLPKGERDFLERAVKIRQFGIAQLGLKDTRNYTSLVKVEGSGVATVVQACEELSFARYLWTYPVVGKLPYKGFFKPEEAKAEAARVKALGYDTLVRRVDAFSTLGWLPDPLFSFMEDYTEAELADLILHEMTHATAFSKAPGDFNEEVATFVGRRGAEAYLKATEGPGSPNLAAARESRRRAEAFSAFLKETATELEALYATDTGPEDKRRAKALILAQRAAAYKAQGPELFGSGAEAEEYRSFDMAGINNAYLDLYRLYEGEGQLYDDYCRLVCGDELRAFIVQARRLAALPDPKAGMRAELENTKAPGK